MTDPPTWRKIVFKQKEVEPPILCNGRKEEKVICPHEIEPADSQFHIIFISSEIDSQCVSLSIYFYLADCGLKTLLSVLNSAALAIVVFGFGRE